MEIVLEMPSKRGYIGYSTSFKENAEYIVLSFKSRLFNWFRFTVASVLLLVFVACSVAWLLLFITSKLEPVLRKGISKVKNCHSNKFEFNIIHAEKSVNDLIENGQSYASEEYSKDILLQQPGAGVFAVMFIALFNGALAITSFVLAFMLRSELVEKMEPTILMFLATDVLAGIVFPFLLLISTFLMVNILDYCTGYRLNSHLIMAKLLPAVELSKKEESGSYWVINENLKVPITHTDKGLQTAKAEERYSCCGSIRMALPSYSTFLVAMFLILSMTFSFSYFIDISFIFQKTFKDSCAGIKHMWYTCFESNNLDLTECSSKNGTGQIFYCYGFNRDWFNVDLTLAVISSFGLYIGVLYILVDIITIAGKLRRFYSRQGLGVVTCSGILFIVTMAMYLIWQTGAFSCVSRILRSYLNILHFIQLEILSLSILIIGLLMKNGTWIDPNEEEKTSIEQTKEVESISLNKFITQDKKDMKTFV